MKECLSLLTVLLVSAALCAGKTPPQNTTQEGAPQTSQHQKHATITGCLTKDDLGNYELVDQKGIHNLVYPSDKFDLDSYVGQSVTLVGDRGAIPSTDTGTARPKPHFKVVELQSASGNCGK